MTSTAAPRGVRRRYEGSSRTRICGSAENASTCSLAARTMPLLGDPQQLPQGVKGSHPPGLELSILEHLLGERIRQAGAIGILVTHSLEAAATADRVLRLTTTGLHG